MKNPDKELAEALGSIGSQFRPNELAYLATTSKVELPFRDRLAYMLHQAYEPDGFLVSREWKRIDLAILRADCRPVCLVELKAMYTFDAFSNLTRFSEMTTADELKAGLLARSYTAVYSLLLVTHLSGAVCEGFVDVVKYSTGINRAVVSHGDGAAVRTKAEAAIEMKLSGRSLVAKGEVLGGRAFGADVSVLYWLIRNTAHELASSDLPESAIYVPVT